MPATPCHMGGGCRGTAGGLLREGAEGTKFFDEHTHEEIEREELEFFKKKGVWRAVPKSRAEGKRVIGTRWVSCNKGDAANPDIRCRLACQEVKAYQSEGFFVATPPLEALRLILRMAADDSELEVSLVEICGRTLTPNCPAKFTSNFHVKPD